MEQLPTHHLLNRCAQAWGLSHIEFVRKMENIVFCCNRGDEKVYLRLTTPLRRARPEIEAEIDWIEHLARCGLKVPHLIPDREGNKITSFAEGDQHFEAVVFSALAGEHPSKEIATDPQFLKTLGALIADMHRASQRYEGTHKGLKREEWFEERGLRHALQAAAISSQSSLRFQLEKAVSWMQQLPRTPQTYGLIHADLGALNLFIGEDSSIGIIDFDDSCYHWFIFDLAIVIFSLAGRFGFAQPQPEEAQWLTDLVEGYRTVLPLDQQEIDLIPRLIHFACLRVYFWIEHHELLHTFHSDALEKVAQTKQWTMDRIRSTG
jgi:amicoumacin kinase